jgi:lipooligosaccharide transport system ATP-binding protein
MKRRLTIARALISDPDLLILDEPTTGLDPQARHLLWDRLYRLKQEGVTLVITTHYMDEAEQLCDRLVVMDKGRFAAEGTPRQLIEPTRPRRWSSCASPRQHEAIAPSWPTWPSATRSCPTASSSTPTTATPPGRGPRHGAAPQSALVRRSTLEDVFLRLTGRTLVD